ncbi:MAG: FAD-dependent oxidoreductase [Proteobacteria bacterium]|nr:FAD-dependent oxidoreductase [Pseudomonadota bacterium]
MTGRFMEELRLKHRETDVLIVGAGGAGMRAAIEAHTMGAKILVVSKGKFPSGCVTATAMGAMLAPFDRQDSVERHIEDTLRGGHYLNDQNLVCILVRHATQRALDLDRYGTEFDKADGRYALFPYTGSTVPRGVLAGDRYRGGFFKGLVKEAQRLGIDILDEIMITDILKEGDTVTGAVGLDLKADTVLIIGAKAVVIATGGAGNLYSLTTNIPGITGDGYVLAFKAGAQLADMEFMQSRACMIYPEAMRGTAPPADGCVTIGGRFYNGLCERYMRKYHPEKMELVTRAEMAKCTQREITEGRQSPHGGVYGDLSGVPPEELAKFKAFLAACAEENFDPAWQPYEWAPGAHHFIGGIVINERCETGIGGLYASGEAEAGVHGANRLAGNALTETQVFGAIAGANAAGMALSASVVPLSQEKITAVTNRILQILGRDEGPDPTEVKNEIATAMRLYVGVLRNEDGLQKAARLFSAVRSMKIDHLSVGKERSFQLLSRLLEVENTLLIGELVTLAATMRKETRGAHNREDYPQTDEEWSKNIVFQLRDGKTIVKTKPVNVVSTSP